MPIGCSEKQENNSIQRKNCIPAGAGMKAKDYTFCNKVLT
jgi:hypothetical protein